MDPTAFTIELVDPPANRPPSPVPYGVPRRFGVGTIMVWHDEQLQRVDVPELRVPRCEACGEMIFDIEAGAQISQALRELLGLLTPAEICDHRKRLGISLHGLAEHLGISSETISLWEEGLRIQTRAMDRYLRVYFQSAEGRAAVVSFAAVPPHA